ncbi:MAG: hypothetical protein SOW77_07795 [Ruminococcus sp.]|nr:hypothetical protein [Ruminococcus sp.]
MIQENETQLEYVSRLFFEEYGFYYASKEETNRPLVKKYKNFIAALNLHDPMTDEEEKLYRHFLKFDITLKSFFAKKTGPNEANKKLDELYDAAQQYYENNIEPTVRNEAKRMSPKDAQIHMMDSKRNDSITRTVNMLSFYQELNDKMAYFYANLFRILSTCKMPKTNPLMVAVDDEIKNYKNKLSSYNAVPSDLQETFDSEEIYYVGKNNNPYKNLYIYCFLQFVKYFIDIRIPSITEKQFDNLQLLRKYRTKSVYSLHDIANMYSEISDISKQKAYDRMKKLFQKYHIFESCKDANGRFSFSEIELPLAYYEMYRKKNIEPNNLTDSIIRSVYCPLIAFAIDGDTEKISAMAKYISFIRDEFLNLTKEKNIDDAKYSTFLEMLLNSSARVELRLLASKEEVDSI